MDEVTQQFRLEFHSLTKALQEIMQEQGTNPLDPETISVMICTAVSVSQFDPKGCFAALGRGVVAGDDRPMEALLALYKTAAKLYFPTALESALKKAQPEIKRTLKAFFAEEATKI